jgi:peptide subunit release factor 1 (eRF1)
MNILYTISTRKMTQSLVKELSKAKATSGGTSLVTFYIPANQQVSNAISKLNSELATSKNIKSKSVSKDVGLALSSALYKLKNTSFEKHSSGDNGLVLCAGQLVSCV